MYERLNFWLLLIPILVFIASCSDEPQVQTNSECFLPGLSVSIWQPIDSLNLDSSIFNYVDDPSEGYANFDHLDTIFESSISIFDQGWFDWNVGELSIYRKMKMKSSEKINIEENLNHIKSIWLNCNVPTDTIDIQIESIKKLIESDSSAYRDKFYSMKINSKLKEMYSWRYFGKRKEGGHSVLSIGYSVY